MQVIVISNGIKNEIEGNEGDNLYSLLVASGYCGNSPCGGKGTCGKCKVRIINGEVSGQIVDKDGYVLSCKCQVIGNLTVELAIMEDCEEITVLATAKANGRYGIAIDIGTTTIAVALVERDSKEVIAYCTALNKQAVYGADVISRIEACNHGRLLELQSVICKQISSTCYKIQQKSGLNNIEKIVIAGNTTMQHILLGVSPRSIGVAPYLPEFTEMKCVKGDDIGVVCDEVIVMPSVSGYIGGDITAGMFALDIMDGSANLLIDLGTNGELAVAVDGKIYCTSTAVGPALEGACIECGIGGVEGAISSYAYNNGVLSIGTINNANACGICGSGLVDIIAILIREGIITDTGLFDEDASSDLVANLVNDKYYLTENIYLSQNDVRQYQLAKSAVFSGIKVLLDAVGLGDGDGLGNVYLAGGVGYYINIANAIASGLLPNYFDGKVTVVGNSSLHGAIKVLTANNAMLELDNIVNSCDVYELSNNPQFAMEYMGNMVFEV